MSLEPGRITTGLPGVTMTAGDHVCAFYRGDAQRDDVLLPYLRAGLRAGERCICVVDAADPDEVVAAIDDEPRTDGDQLSVFRSEDTYLAGECFSIEKMLAFWDRGVDAALEREDCTFVRSVGEMTWALRELPGVEQLVEYEARLNRFLPRYPQVILCLYDLDRFTDGEVLIDILRTHPKVLMSGIVLDNPWYIEPAEFLTTVHG